MPSTDRLSYDTAVSAQVQADITGIFDLTALNSVLGEGAAGTKISAQGLGKD